MKYYCSILYRFHLMIFVILISSYLKAGGVCNNELPSSGYVTVHNKTDMAIVLRPHYFYTKIHIQCPKSVGAQSSRKIYWEYPMGVDNIWRLRAQYMIFHLKADTRPKDILAICYISTDGATGKLNDCNKITNIGLNSSVVRLKLSNTCGASDSNKKPRTCDLYIEYPEK